MGANPARARTSSHKREKRGLNTGNVPCRSGPALVHRHLQGSLACPTTTRRPRTRPRHHQRPSGAQPSWCTRHFPVERGKKGKRGVKKQKTSCGDQSKHTRLRHSRVSCSSQVLWGWRVRARGGRACLHAPQVGVGNSGRAPARRQPRISQKNVIHLCVSWHRPPAPDRFPVRNHPHKQHGLHSYLDKRDRLHAPLGRKLHNRLANGRLAAALYHHVPRRQGAKVTQQPEGSRGTRGERRRHLQRHRLRHRQHVRRRHHRRVTPCAQTSLWTANK